MIADLLRLQFPSKPDVVLENLSKISMRVVLAVYLALPASLQAVSRIEAVKRCTSASILVPALPHYTLD